MSFTLAFVMCFAFFVAGFGVGVKYMAWVIENTEE